MTYELGETNGVAFIRCLRCNRASYNPNDIEHKYCGHCHAWHGRPEIKTVHILHHGLPLCGFSQARPVDWPEGHGWVGLDDAAPVNCPQCKEGNKN